MRIPGQLHDGKPASRTFVRSFAERSSAAIQRLRLAPLTPFAAETFAAVQTIFADLESFRRHGPVPPQAPGRSVGPGRYAAIDANQPAFCSRFPELPPNDAGPNA